MCQCMFHTPCKSSVLLQFCELLLRSNFGPSPSCIHHTRDVSGGCSRHYGMARERFTTRGQEWLDTMFDIDDLSDDAMSSASTLPDVASSVGLPVSTGNLIRADVPIPVPHPPRVVDPSDLRSFRSAPYLAPLEQTHRVVAEPVVARPPAAHVSQSDATHHADVAPDVATLSNVCPIEPLAASGDWRAFKVCMHRTTDWWNGASGIIDARVIHFQKNPTACEGTKLEVAFNRCTWALRRHECEFKIGIARLLGSRWQMYQESTDKWQPTHLFILLEVRGREAAGYVEAALIRMMWDSDKYDDMHNINYRNNDKGGAGPRQPEHEHAVYCVYLAVKADV